MSAIIIKSKPDVEFTFTFDYAVKLDKANNLV